MKKEYYLHIIFGLFAMVVWFVPEHPDIKIKLLISGIIVISIVLILFKEKLYIFRKYWQEMISFTLLTSVLLFFNNTFPDLLIPAIVILPTSVAIALLLGLKYKQGFVYKKKVLLKKIAIDNSWILNHWLSNCARLVGDKMVFIGTSAPKMTDGSHITLSNLLEVGKTYEISCFAKSVGDTDGMFQLWCHDNTGAQPQGTNEQTAYKTPSTKGERVGLNFKANYNPNIRIHLQYSPGKGQIEVSDVIINELKN